MTYKLINQGRSAEVYEYGKGTILKLFRPGFPMPAIKLEYTVGRIINNTHLGPRLIKKMMIGGRTGFVYERIYGPPMIFALVKKPWLVFHYATLMAELHFKTHQVTSTELPDQKKTLALYILKADLLDKQTKTNIIAHLKTLPSPHRICHGDFHPDNIILSPTGPVIIDWMSGTNGDPAADFTRTLLLLKYAELPSDKKTVEKLIVQIFRTIIYYVYKYQYQLLSHVSDEEIKQWESPVIAARLFEPVPEGEKRKLLQLLLHEKVLGDSSQRN